MKKDLQSQKEHDQDYIKLHTLEYVKDILKKYEDEKMFENLGFEQAIKKLHNINTHIDVGCGSGWLLYKTSPLFNKVIGIEPSKAIIEVNNKIVEERNLTNVEFVNMDMIDALKHIKPTVPVFITTAVVLSHIKDFYVARFLKEVNRLPEGSALFFDERYDKNIQQNMWHIRSKNWWAENLPDWQLEFFELNNSGYKSGIFATKVKKGEKINRFKLNPKEKIKWHIDGLINKKNRLYRFVKNKIKKLT
jgi:SAM-dependent methyltransferase